MPVVKFVLFSNLIIKFIVISYHNFSNRVLTPEVAQPQKWSTKHLFYARDRNAYRVWSSSSLSELSDKLSTSSASSLFSISIRATFRKRSRFPFNLNFAFASRAIRNTSSVV